MRHLNEYLFALLNNQPTLQITRQKPVLWEEGIPVRVTVLLPYKGKFSHKREFFFQTHLGELQLYVSLAKSFCDKKTHKETKKVYAAAHVLQKIKGKKIRPYITMDLSTGRGTFIWKDSLTKQEGSRDFQSINELVSLLLKFLREIPSLTTRKHYVGNLP
jgi:hypothetical protein